MTVAIEVVCGSVATIVANAVVVGLYVGRREEKLKQVVEDVGTIKQALGFANGDSEPRFMSRALCDAHHDQVAIRIDALAERVDRVENARERHAEAQS